MKISRMNKGEWGNVKAYFDIETVEHFIMKGFKIVLGSNGLFVSFPSQKNKDDEYNDTIFADKQLRAEVEKFAMEYFQNNVEESLSSNNNQVKEELPF